MRVDVVVYGPLLVLSSLLFALLFCVVADGDFIVLIMCLCVYCLCVFVDGGVGVAFVMC